MCLGSLQYRNECSWRKNITIAFASAVFPTPAAPEMSSPRPELTASVIALTASEKSFSPATDLSHPARSRRVATMSEDTFTTLRSVVRI